MVCFNVLKPWVVLAPAAARKAAADMARCVALLRPSPAAGPKVLDADGPAPDDSVPVIVLNAAAPDTENGRRTFAKNGYSWRAGGERVEIYGDSPVGLRKGVYDFLSALGFSWSGVNEEKVPALNASGDYQLKDRSSLRRADTDAAARRRLFIAPKDKPRACAEKIAFAARGGYDAVVVPFAAGAARAALVLAAEWNLEAERGGGELSLLVPRGAFLLHRECFRMENGRRRRRGLFCPTNPDTLAIIRRQAEKLFARARAEAESHKAACPAFHLYPAETETAWCNCPACRAFPAAEQYRMAINTAADVASGAGVASGAVIFCKKLPGLPENAIALRENVVESQP